MSLVSGDVTRAVRFERSICESREAIAKPISMARRVATSRLTVLSRGKNVGSEATSMGAFRTLRRAPRGSPPRPTPTMLGSAPLARPAAEAPSARVSSRAAPAAPRLGSVARDPRRLETRSRTRASAAVSPGSTPAVPSASATGVFISEVPAPPYEPSAHGSSSPSSLESRWVPRWLRWPSSSRSPS